MIEWRNISVFQLDGRRQTCEPHNYGNMSKLSSINKTTFLIIMRIIINLNRENNQK